METTFDKTIGTHIIVVTMALHTVNMIGFSLMFTSATLVQITGMIQSVNLMS